MQADGDYEPRVSPRAANSTICCSADFFLCIGIKFNGGSHFTFLILHPGHNGGSSCLPQYIIIQVNKEIFSSLKTKANKQTNKETQRLPLFYSWCSNKKWIKPFCLKQTNTSHQVCQQHFSRHWTTVSRSRRVEQKPRWSSVDFLS